MPPNTSEVRHYHKFSRQFFFVLNGMATLEVNRERLILNPQEGYEIPPLILHQIINETDFDLEIMVNSKQNSRGIVS